MSRTVSLLEKEKVQLFQELSLDSRTAVTHQSFIPYFTSYVKESSYSKTFLLNKMGEDN